DDHRFASGISERRTDAHELCDQLDTLSSLLLAGRASCASSLPRPLRSARARCFTARGLQPRVSSGRLARHGSATIFDVLRGAVEPGAACKPILEHDTAKSLARPCAG